MLQSLHVRLLIQSKQIAMISIPKTESVMNLTLTVFENPLFAHQLQAFQLDLIHWIHLLCQSHPSCKYECSTKEN